MDECDPAFPQSVSVKALAIVIHFYFSLSDRCVVISDNGFNLQSLMANWQPTPGFLPGEIPGTEEPGGLPSTGSHRVGQD